MTNVLQRRLCAILGVPIDIVTMHEAVDLIEAMVIEGSPHYVATANVNFLVMTQRDPEFMEVVRMADMIVADGMPIVWASRLLGAPLPERVTGSDITPRLCALAARKGWKVFFLGGADGVGAEAIARLRQEHPGLKAYHYSPEFNPLLEMNDAKILAVIRQTAPKLLFVSFGAGKAEKWLRMHRDVLQVPVSMGVGATVDFLAGRVKRAPLWMQRSGTEWLFRLAQEPGRMWRRYTGDTLPFLMLFGRQWLQYKMRRLFTRDAGNASIPHNPKPGESRQLATLSVSGRLDAATSPHLAKAVEQALEQGQHVCLHMGDVTLMDSRGLGTLVGLEKEVRRRDGRSGRLVLVAVSKDAMRALSLAKMDRFFNIVQSDEDAQALALAQSAASKLQSRNQGPLQYVTEKQRKLFISLQGRLDADGAAAFKSELMTTLDASLANPIPPEFVSLDFTNVRFIDSACLTVLILAFKKLRRKNVELRVRGLHGDISRIFGIMKMDRYLQIDTTEAA